MAMSGFRVEKQVARHELINGRELDKIASKINRDNFPFIVVKVDVRIVSCVRDVSVEQPALQEATFEIVVIAKHVTAFDLVSGGWWRAGQLVLGVILVIFKIKIEVKITGLGE